MADVTISQLSEGLPNKNSAVIPYSDGTTTLRTSPSGIVAASPGALLQVVSTSDNTYRTTSTPIPADNTIPQITEGALFLSLSITPKSANSQLLFMFEAYCMELGNTGDWSAFPLFRDNNANAINVFYQEMSHSASLNMFRCNGHFLYQNNTTNTTTYSVRWGLANGGTIATLGGVTYYPAGLYGGLVSNKLTVQEIAS